MYRLRLMCMDDGLHKEGDIIDGSIWEHSEGIQEILYCMDTDAGNNVG